MSFEAKLAKGEFCIPECTDCKKIVWPPAEFCSYCFGNIHLKKEDCKGKVIEFSREKNWFFCLVEFNGMIRIMGLYEKDAKSRPDCKNFKMRHT